MGQILFVVWRESFEALLIIGILYTWIKQHADNQNGMNFLWGGVICGLLLSGLLALLIYGVFSLLGDTSQSIFMVIMELAACFLIVHMVYWMNQSGRSFQSSLENTLESQTQQHSWWGVLIIITIAIAREGSEIVVFLSSFIMTLTSKNIASFTTEVLLGVLLSTITFIAFLKSAKVISWRWFFKITGAILLFLALSLLLKAVEEITNLLAEFDIDFPDILTYPAWNTCELLDDSSIIGNFIASFFAYRCQPIWLCVITFILYWIVIARIFSRGQRHES